MAQDLQILKQLGKQIGTKLKPVESEVVFGWESRGSLAIDKNKNVVGLNLYDSGITDISVLQELTNLTRLDLSSNQIIDISVLKELTKLSWVDFNHNKISELPVEIVNLNL